MLTQEHRQWQRIPVLFDAKYRGMECVFAPFAPASLLDLHPHGCRLIGNAPMMAGDDIAIVVDIPGEGLMTIEGAVVWSKPAYQDRGYELGVHFHHDHSAGRMVCAKLLELCRFNMPGYQELVKF